MATKKESSEVLRGLWGLVDQAGHDQMIEEAFRLISQKDQLRFIESLIRNGQNFINTDEEREQWEELEKRAHELLKKEQERKDRVESYARHLSGLRK